MIRPEAHGEGQGKSPDVRGLRIRPYDGGDADATLRIFTDAITVTASEDYTAEQIAAWARSGQRDIGEWDAAMRRRSSWVAVIGERVIGFSDVSADGYVDMMFVSPDAARRGVARALMEFLEARAVRLGATELSADVSVTARPFFEAMGFCIRNEQHPVIDGIELVNFRMTKPLA